MATDSCSTCLHYRPLDYVHRPSGNDPEIVGRWGACVLIGDAADTTDSQPHPLSDRAFTRDGSDYWSALYVRDDFGCIEHDPGGA